MEIQQNENPTSNPAIWRTWVMVRRWRWLPWPKVRVKTGGRGHGSLFPYRRFSYSKAHRDRAAAETIP